MMPRLPKWRNMLCIVQNLLCLLNSFLFNKKKWEACGVFQNQMDITYCLKVIKYYYTCIKEMFKWCGFDLWFDAKAGNFINRVYDSPRWKVINLAEKEASWCEKLLDNKSSLDDHHDP